jgi:hypothetical protein
MYPGATQLASAVQNPFRTATWGIVIHETYGHPGGDIPILRAEGSPGNRVDVQFYVEHSGKVFQFLDSDRGCWGAMATANDTCVQIEHEGDGSPWPDAQIHASARLVAWLCVRYKIPVRYTRPFSGQPATFRGIFGHRDLSVDGVDGNTHTDTLPSNVTWPRYLTLVASYLPQVGGPKPHPVFGFGDPQGQTTMPGKWKFKAFAEHRRRQLGSLGAHADSINWHGFWWVILPAHIEPYLTRAARDADMALRAAQTGRTMQPFTRLVI